MTSLNITRHLLYVYFRLRTANFFTKTWWTLGLGLVWVLGLGLLLWLWIVLESVLIIAAAYRPQGYQWFPMIWTPIATYRPIRRRILISHASSNTLRTSSVLFKFWNGDVNRRLLKMKDWRMTDEVCLIRVCAELDSFVYIACRFI